MKDLLMQVGGKDRGPAFVQGKVMDMLGHADQSIRKCMLPVRDRQDCEVPSTP